MNATNRVVNRGLLFAAGAVLLVAGVVAILVGIRPGWAEPALAVVDRAAGQVGAGLDAVRIELPGGAALPGPALALLVVAVLGVVGALVFLFTRGGGRTADVLRIDASDGRTSVDRTVADAVIGGALGARPDVLSARTSAYRVRRRPAVALTLSVRRGAPLGAVLAAAESAVSDWDALAGESIPVMVHIADPRWRDALRSRTRVR
ncbi:hypothetical protein [Streptomyces sp. AC495_CC817]|uniref:hypothetical protein n=1 Tax=Streptomyces sp. AC495_CC817 TaxID=2823900 RepID=UPI001C271AAE|nr:hypothetical protein [Streptomyces sp. AC495_CC817]